MIILDLNEEEMGRDASATSNTFKPTPIKVIYKYIISWH